MLRFDVSFARIGDEQKICLEHVEKKIGTDRKGTVERLEFNIDSMRGKKNVARIFERLLRGKEEESNSIRNDTTNTSRINSTRNEFNPSETSYRGDFGLDNKLIPSLPF